MQQNIEMAEYDYTHLSPGWLRGYGLDLNFLYLKRSAVRSQQRL